MENPDYYAYFGDGNTALIIKVKDHINNETGKKTIRFILKPTTRIEVMYDISEEQNQQGFIFREYPETEVIFLERETNRIRCWVETDFNGGETPASRRRADFKVALEDTNRLLRSERAAKNRAYRELEIARTQQRMALKLQTDMVKEVAKARGRVDGETGEGYNIDAGAPE